MKITKLIMTVIGMVLTGSFLLSFGIIENKTLPTSPAISQMIADWERAKAYTKEYLDAASDQTLDYKPTAEMRTFRQHMLHISAANYNLSAAATGAHNSLFAINQY